MKHSWVWREPDFNLRIKKCLQCGMVVSIQNHKKVGECKGTICDKCGGTGYVKEESKC